MKQRETRTVQGGGYRPLGQGGLEREDDSTLFTGDFVLADSPRLSKRLRAAGETPKCTDEI